MPTYDYVCAACGHKFEHFQSMTSRRLRKCPACGERKLERLVGSGSGIIFKGSGFYETDYKRAGARGGASSQGKGSSKSEASGSEASKSGNDAPKKDAAKNDAGKSDAGKKDAGGKNGEKAGR